MARVEVAYAVLRAHGRAEALPHALSGMALGFVPALFAINVRVALALGRA